jgi:hypothetical protein
MTYVKYEDKSTVSNTRWPDIRIKRALPRKFPCYSMKKCIDGRIECLTITVLRPSKYQHSIGRSNTSPRGFESGDSNLNKLADVFATMQLTGPLRVFQAGYADPHSNHSMSFFEASKLPFEYLYSASKALACLSFVS